MNPQAISALSLIALALGSCRTAETAAAGTANTVGHAAQGVGRTAVIGGKGISRTVGSTATTVGSGISEGNLNKATVGAAKTAGEGTATTAVDAGRSHLKTTSGVLKDTGKTIRETDNAASGQ